MKKLNKEGFSFIDVIIGLILLSILIKMVYSFENSSTNIMNAQRDKVELNSVILNEVDLAYCKEDWANIEDKKIKIKNDPLNIKFIHNQEDELVESLTVIINSKDKQLKEITLERSDYRDE